METKNYFNAGAKVAQYAGVNLHKFVVKQPEYATGNIEEAMRKVNNFLI